MDANRRKQLIEEYKNHRPEMGIISFRCMPNGQVFLGKTNDTRTGFNSLLVRLSSNSHPNKVFQSLWNEHGAEKFEQTVFAVLSVKDIGEKDDYSYDLENLLTKCLEQNPEAIRMWK